MAWIQSIVVYPGMSGQALQIDSILIPEVIKYYLVHWLAMFFFDSCTQIHEDTLTAGRE